MIVRMYQLAAEDLVGPIGNDLVDVHIGLCAAAGLIDHQWEMLVQLPAGDFVRRLDDRAGSFFIQHAECSIRFCRRSF